MTDDTTSSWREHLILNRDARTDAARADLGRRAARGELVRVVAGAYLPKIVWDGYDERERYLAPARVLASKHAQPMVFCRETAAAIWGLPWFGNWPDSVHVLRSEGSAGQYANKVSRHVSHSDPEPVVVDGLLVTSLARTVADVARLPGFLRAVVVGDAALNPERRSSLAASAAPLTKEILLGELTLSPLAAARAGDVIAFLDGRSGSPGESISRVSMWRADVPAPVLQQEFSSWQVDFWWPEYGVIGEFDGKMKYTNEAMRGGRSAEEIVYSEKVREDALRRRCKGFARWGYVEAVRPALLVGRLRAAGIPIPHRARFAAVSVI